MSKKIYVGNLSYQATEEEVRELFEAHGAVESIAMINDRDTGKFRGFCFVEMANNDADAAIAALDGKEVDGRNLRVNEARPREDRGGGNRGGGSRSGGFGGGNRGSFSGGGNRGGSSRGGSSRGGGNRGSGNRGGGYGGGNRDRDDDRW